MTRDLFRKVSIERLTSPEQLDKLLIIVKIRGWLALIALLIITFGFILIAQKVFRKYGGR